MNTLALRTTGKILTYELQDILRSRWLIVYGAFFLIATDLLFRFGGTGAQVMLSLMNAVLILIPLICIVFGTMYLYAAREFIELMLTQPLDRKHLFAGLYLGLAVPLSVTFALGLSLPFAIHGIDASIHGGTLLTMVAAGVFLTFIFTALAFLIVARFDDRVKGLSLAVFLWLFFSVVYDGMLLALVNMLSNYPLERLMIGLTVLNPIDLARVLLLLDFDISALMGYTGAVFEQFFGSSMGIGISIGALSAWSVVPFVVGRRLFQRRDF